MNKLMRKFPLIIAAVLILVQVSGLVAYSDSAANMHGLRSWAFSVGIEATVFLAAYFTRYQVTRWAAIAVLTLSLLVSGFLNTAKSITDLPTNADDLARISAVVFGVVPTLFATVLGALQAYVAKLPPLGKSYAGDTIPMQVYAIATKWLALVNARLSSADAPANAKDAHDGKRRCKKCGAWVQNPGNHARWDCPKRERAK